MQGMRLQLRQVVCGCRQGQSSPTRSPLTAVSRVMERGATLAFQPGAFWTRWRW